MLTCNVGQACAAPDARSRRRAVQDQACAALLVCTAMHSTSATRSSQDSLAHNRALTFPSASNAQACIA